MPEHCGLCSAKPCSESGKTVSQLEDSFSLASFTYLSGRRWIISRAASWINALPASWLTLSHLSLVFGLTKPTVLKNALLVVFSTAALFLSSYLRIPLPANMQEVVNMTCTCVTRKTSATSGAQVNTNRQLACVG